MNNEKQMEADILELGLTADRITPEYIDSLMEKVTYDVHVPAGTTTTVVTAFDRNGFSLCTEIMACASPENYNAEFGAKYGIEKAAASAREKLWELEGYMLKCHLAVRGAA